MHTKAEGRANQVKYRKRKIAVGACMRCGCWAKARPSRRYCKRHSSRAAR